MASSRDEGTAPPAAATSSNTANFDKETMIRSVISAVMESQAATVTNMAKEAVDAMMARSDDKVADQIEEGFKKKEKLKADLKNEGNSDQYKHQKELLENLEDVERAVDRNDVSKAKAAIDTGKKLIMKRIKLIRLADREDWATVREYVSDDLASDSDDDKQIAKAIKLSAAKREKLKKAKGRKFDISRGGSRGRSGRYSRFSGRSRTPLICYSCGSPGHGKWQCYSSRKRDTPLLGRPTA